MISDEKEVNKGREDRISSLLEAGEDELLIIDGDTIFEEGDRDGNALYLSVFYCLFFMKERTMNVLEE